MKKLGLRVIGGFQTQELYMYFFALKKLHSDVGHIWMAVICCEILWIVPVQW